MGISSAAGGDSGVECDVLGVTGDVDKRLRIEFRGLSFCDEEVGRYRVGFSSAWNGDDCADEFISGASGAPHLMYCRCARLELR
jgi:hypothetical protein